MSFTTENDLTINGLMLEQDRARRVQVDRVILSRRTSGLLTLETPEPTEDDYMRARLKYVGVIDRRDQMFLDLMNLHRADNTHCERCGTELLFFINASAKSYSLCDACDQQLEEEFSKESRTSKIRGFLD